MSVVGRVMVVLGIVVIVAQFSIGREDTFANWITVPNAPSGIGGGGAGDV